ALVATGADDRTTVWPPHAGIGPILPLAAFRYLPAASVYISDEGAPNRGHRRNDVFGRVRVRNCRGRSIGQDEVVVRCGRAHDYTCAALHEALIQRRKLAFVAVQQPGLNSVDARDRW